MQKPVKEGSISVITKQQYLTPHRTPSPVWRKRTPEPPSESPLPAVVPDLSLARTDSGKTNTDISESTTTTDDYITANSGTDSSRRSGSIKVTNHLICNVIIYKTVLKLNSNSYFSLHLLFHSLTSSFCFFEAIFCEVAGLKTKKTSTLKIENELIVSVCNIELNFGKLGWRLNPLTKN